MTKMKSPFQAVEVDIEVPPSQLHVFHKVPKDKIAYQKM